MPEHRPLSPEARPAVIAHADWSREPGRRWLAVAVLEEGKYTAHPPRLAGDLSTLPGRLLSRAGRDASVLAGFDFPIGVPARYAERAGIQSFREVLPRLGRAEWSRFYDVAETRDEIAPRRPFYPQRPGGTALKHLLDGLGVESKDDLLRRCDKGHPGRPAAESIFWTMGAKQVGKAAISGWRDLLAPTLRSPVIDLALWPFEGPLETLLRPGRIVMAETYPAEFYGHFGLEFGSKRNQEDRRSTTPTLLRWAEENGVVVAPDLRLDLDLGFGTAPEGEDPFDAVIGLFGMLNVVLGDRPTGEPDDPSVKEIEGWIFGQVEAPNAPTTGMRKDGPRVIERPDQPTRVLPRVDASEASGAPAEYDPLADLYDLEYVHDYDARFWLSLAEREDGPVVEWGAGTGRLAVPLSKAGHDVTAVELSRRMVEKGRHKDGNVRWVAGDMRTARLGQRFGLAVCAFNSFLCLPTQDDALAFLENARGHLIPNGLLGIEVTAFSPEELADPPGGGSLRHDFTRETPGGWLDRFSVSRYDAASQIMEMRLFYESYDDAGVLKSRRAHDLEIRICGFAELGLMLRLSGFVVESAYGGFDAEPFESSSDHLILLARNPPHDRR